ncbi:surfeit locus protein 1-like [Artemia franciscana]|uniref:surfeit locus protein 1-like n=1 Tax=Artemia franciscana TaxID=6661 RepID=UPI0032DAA2F5
MNSAGRLFRRYASRIASTSRRNPEITASAIGLLTIPVGTFLLGSWQVRRRQWKLNLMEELEERQNSPPVNLPENKEEIEALEYSRVKTRGRFIYDKEVLIGPRPLIESGDVSSGGGLISTGQSGYYVVTPFEVSGKNMTILVNRGWIPHKARKFGITKEPIPGPEGEIELEGVVRRTEPPTAFTPASTPEKGIWHSRDVESMSNILKTDPIFVDATSKMVYTNGPIPGQTRVALRNDHLSYLITWYTLSGITGYMWFRNFIQRRPTFL